MAARILAARFEVPRGRPESTSPIGSFGFCIFSIFSKSYKKSEFPIVSTILDAALGASLRGSNLASPIGSLYFYDAFLAPKSRTGP